MHQLHRSYVVTREAIEHATVDIKALVLRDCTDDIQREAQRLTDRFVTDYHRWYHVRCEEGEHPTLRSEADMVPYDLPAEHPGWTHAILHIWTRPFTPNPAGARELNWFVESCVRPNQCTCMGHRIPGVHHVTPCCDQPHTDHYIPITLDTSKDPA